MRSIFIENDFLNPESKKSKFLFTSLRHLMIAGYSLKADESVFLKWKCLKPLFESEKIKIKAGKKSCNSIIIGKEYKDLQEAVSKLCCRSSEIIRKTGETEIRIKLDLDNGQKRKITTGIGFFDHMLEQIARHANLSLEIEVKGDLNVDEHHTVEDTGIVLGQAIAEALGEKRGIKRFGFFIPMDESVSLCTIDLSGRSYLNFNCEFKRDYVGGFPVELTEEFFRALSSGMKANIYIKAKGKNDHHKIESIFKSFAKSLNEACRIDERNNNRVPSTKGVL